MMSELEKSTLAIFKGEKSRKLSSSMSFQPISIISPSGNQLTKNEKNFILNKKKEDKRKCPKFLRTKGTSFHYQKVKDISKLKLQLSSLLKKRRRDKVRGEKLIKCSGSQNSRVF